MGSRPRGVILTARRAVFICGDMEVMVPCRIVPMCTVRLLKFVKWNEAANVKACIRCFSNVPFLSSMVTVSLAHFIKNLREVSPLRFRALRARVQLLTAGRWKVDAYLTSFIVAFDLLQMLRHQCCGNPYGELVQLYVGVLVQIAVVVDLHEPLALQSSGCLRGTHIVGTVCYVSTIQVSGTQYIIG